MDATFPLLFAAVVGFTHAFEADHLVAVSNIVTKRNKILLATKDGLFWGLGHTSTILIIGLILISWQGNFSGWLFRLFRSCGRLNAYFARCFSIVSIFPT